ncbi:cation transporter [Stenotrophomonas maltophilia]|uniref:cation transporter n=1 Tax=Stenotrophomonas maltophilia TaxID=40324 RepID=UPI0015DFAE53|nr:cation transporter [Stenotrophomonas maltophilia]MBA0279689.1 cation transporter [Stenotrophomonas maltophilia]MBA0343663.1 cation transporter [Stenotrophomonas maltophilia]MBA0355902.1 cation transporter [Stenotrophomonas maltophilia]MBA0517923.1 cation transporter [Stenotrophomonas maltophilia]
MDHCCGHKRQELEALAHHGAQRRVLVAVLIINLAMFFIEFGAGIVARSSALQADAVDMLGDAIVYGLSLWAVNRGARWEAGAALAKGLLILAFFVFIVVEVVSKLMHGVPPSSGLMLGFGAIALVANLICLALLWRFRALNINMKSTFECSRNDVVANLGVLVAAGGVALTGSGWPDIAAGAVIALLFLKSAVGVISEAWPAWRAAAKA